MVKKQFAKSVLLGRVFFPGAGIDRIMALSMLFSVTLVMIRILYTGKLTFIFLVWNLFLAVVPYALTIHLVRKPQIRENKIKFAVLFVLWILFIPNSFYIITDLFHLGYNYTAPLWFDLAMILSFAWNGLILGILSVRQMEKTIDVFLPGRNSFLFIYPVMWLNALGIYIGRYLRFNSWDVFTNPFELVVDICKILVHPIQFRHAWGMIICFSVFMTLMYFTIKKISKERL